MSVSLLNCKGDSSLYLYEHAIALTRQSTMKFIIFGGSGQIGRLPGRQVPQQGGVVTAVSRHSIQLPWISLLWDGTTAGKWVREHAARYQNE